jgi:uncharacterized surface protein with fasciclin (FAS1) repeats
MISLAFNAKNPNAETIVVFYHFICGKARRSPNARTAVRVIGYYYETSPDATQQIKYDKTTCAYGGGFH